MARDADALKLADDAAIWAESGDTTTMFGTLDREEGWTSAYSSPPASGGEDLSRERWNQLIRELTAFCYEVQTAGVLEWHGTPTYLEGAVVNHEGGMWRAERDNQNVEPGTSADDWVDLFS